MNIKFFLRVINIGCQWIDWHPEGNLLATGGYEKVINILDIRSGKLTTVLNELGLYNENFILFSFML